jgi:hypothetical protein
MHESAGNLKYGYCGQLLNWVVIGCDHLFATKSFLKVEGKNKQSY